MPPIPNYCQTLIPGKAVLAHVSVNFHITLGKSHEAWASEHFVSRTDDTQSQLQPPRSVTFELQLATPTQRSGSGGSKKEKKHMPFSCLRPVTPYRAVGQCPTTGFLFAHCTVGIAHDGGSEVK